MSNETAPDDYAHALRLEELKQQIRDSPGGKARALWDSVRRSVNVFNRNAYELVPVLLAAEKEEQLAIELFQNVRPSPVRQEYFGLLDQKLHNMLASAVSLVDHTRRLTEKYDGTDFQTQFTTHNDAVRRAGSSAFLRNLRNYLLHYGVLNFVHTISFTSPVVSEVRLVCAELLGWDGWSAGSEAYMATCGETVHLSATVQEYIASMQSLYAWVFEQFEGLHGADVDATNALVKEFNLTLSGGTTDGRDWPEFMAHVQENLRATREGRPQTDYRTGAVIDAEQSTS